MVNPKDKAWRFSEEEHLRNVSEGKVWWGAKGELKVPRYKRFLCDVRDGVIPKSIWDDVGTNQHGKQELESLGYDETIFQFPKPTELVKRCVSIAYEYNPTILDYFAGSGTTGHAAISLNREDGGRRKFILVEMGDYFDTVLLPRIKKVTYTPEWNSGKPKRFATAEEAERSPHIVKVVRLESYEDALNNLEFKRTEKQIRLLEYDTGLREQYVLSYMLDVESRGSQSLLNVDGFRNPDQYKLKVNHNGEPKLVKVDLVETFNWLLGLTVKHIDVIRGVRVIEGASPTGERILVLWRDLEEIDNDKLDEWFEKQGYNTRDLEYDLIYVNGDNNIENLRRDDQTWKVRLIENEFQRLMFAR
jgi:adenine-specific DNA-methyltransferase